MATSTSAINIRLVEPRNTIKIPNTTISLLQLCHFPHEVEQVHAQLIVSGLIHHPLNPGRLIESYISSSRFSYALSVFESIPNPDLFAYNNMIRGLMLSPEYPDHLSLLMYQKLLSAGLKPDNHTFTFALKTCSRMNAYLEGKQIHGQMMKAGIELSVHGRNSLVYMYSICGDMESANLALLADGDNDEENVLAMNCLITGCFRQGKVENAQTLFEKMAKKDTATWSAMITGYNSCDMHGEALRLFQEMLADGVQSTESTLVGALSACGSLGTLDQGRWIHRLSLCNFENIHTHSLKVFSCVQ
ncbi:OLC1v1022360C1 [Oldenlandia corymbosa var. corymbosa]|uniref:OLC1v1022360C1 n=1 Tax=Oldenlandia corymbosa var. corymbosa TaxID=529605 RepID=A0AAV1BXV1_OLDCO|nr:OLC1v1022360C1 [Oldenlandia corymbosa var. corymbosa]